MYLIFFIVIKALFEVPNSREGEGGLGVRENVPKTRNFVLKSFLVG